MRNSIAPLNLLPLLRFRPGGVQKELAVQLSSGGKGIEMRCILRVFASEFIPLQKKNSPPVKFFIDTANLDEIREASELGILDGVTTNPSLMAKEGITGHDQIMDHYARICALVPGDVSAEVIATSYKEIIEEGSMLAAIAPNIVVKVPMIRDGVKALRWFREHDIRTNCTLVFSAGQAILAAKAGATYLSPFIGRIDDINWEGMELIRQIVDIFDIQGYETQVLAASIRSSMHIVQAAESGAHVATCPLSAILGLLKHPLTDIGLEKFLADHHKAAGSPARKVQT